MTVWRQRSATSYELVLRACIIYVRRVEYSGEEQWLVTCRRAGIVNEPLPAGDAEAAKREAVAYVRNSLRVTLSDVDQMEREDP